MQRRKAPPAGGAAWSRCPLSTTQDSESRVCLAWFQNREMLPFWMNSTGRREGWQRGWHGYDNELMDMRGIFLAFGPGRRGNDQILSDPIPREASVRGGYGCQERLQISLQTLFMSQAEQTQPVSMKHLLLASFQMLLGFGKCSQILCLVNFKS